MIVPFVPFCGTKYVLPKMMGYGLFGSCAFVADAFHVVKAEPISPWHQPLPGGTVASISAWSSFVVAKPSLSDALERGTPHFQGILSLPAQQAEVNRLGSAWARHHHALAVCHEAFLRTSGEGSKNGDQTWWVMMCQWLQ